MTLRFAGLCLWLVLEAAAPLYAVAQAAPQQPRSRDTCTDLSRTKPELCPDEDGTLPSAPGSTAPKSGSTSHEPEKSSSGRDADSGQGSLQQDAQPGSSQRATSPERALPRNMVTDQKRFWTSPLRLRLHDLVWLLPVAGASAGLVDQDTRIESHLPSNASLIRHSKDFGTYGAAAFAGAVGGSYLWGRYTHNDHLRETGLLSGEAAANTFLLTSLFKVVAGRQRPLEGNGTGQFRSGERSFPSEHAAAAWSIATVVANEYPSPFAKLLAYGGASAMSASRLLGRQHFASDVFVGSALGYFIGREVYHAHAQGAEGVDKRLWGTFVKHADQESTADPANMGSPYVPLDSWVYGAFDRLAALGYLHSGLTDMRPWTRRECARLVEEMESSTGGSEAPPGGALLEALKAEFADEDRLVLNHNLGARVESVYFRGMQISGTPLNDGLHFGQTLTNDFGRPFGEGTNAIAGFTASASAGPLAVFVRGEYQHAPDSPAYSPQTRLAVATADSIATTVGPSAYTPPAILFPAVSRFRLLEGYVALNVQNWQLSFGKQSLWWGPGRGGPMSFSSNAEPITMFRVNRTTPVKLPSIFGWLGPMRTEFFVGQLSGARFIAPTFDAPVVGPVSPQPYLNGQKISFKPTPNLEFGVSRTAIFGGAGRPLTWRTFGRSIFSLGNQTSPDDPGDRRAGFDFSYRIPKLRNWLVLYNDSMTDDEFSPIAYPRRSAMNPGIFMPQLPFLPKMDFRLEAAYTDLPNLRDVGFFYFNQHYRSGYTNNGFLLGHWVGREGRALQSWLRYWIGPRSTIEAGYRNGWVDPEFIQGGQLNDFAVRANLMLRQDLNLSTFVQYENWKFPAIAAGRQSNVTSSFQLTYYPRWASK